MFLLIILLLFPNLKPGNQGTELVKRFYLTHKSSKIVSEFVLKCTLTTEEIHKSTLDLDGIFY